MDYINKVKVGDKEYNIGGIYTVSVNENSTIGDILDQLPVDKENFNLFTVIIGFDGEDVEYGYIQYSLPNIENHYFHCLGCFPLLSNTEISAGTYEELAEIPFSSLEREGLGSYAPSVEELSPEDTYDLRYQDGQVQWVLHEVKQGGK